MTKPGNTEPIRHPLVMRRRMSMILVPVGLIALLAMLNYMVGKPEGPEMVTLAEYSGGYANCVTALEIITGSRSSAKSTCANPARNVAKRPIEPYWTKERLLGVAR